MKNIITTIVKIIAGIFAILIPFYLVIQFAENVVFIHNYHTLKWVQLLIIASGFYISGLINSKTSLKWIPFLYISLLVCVPMRSIYFPFFFFVVLFATISLFLTRKEFKKKYRLISFSFMTALFVYFLLSQPLIIRRTKQIVLNNNGEPQNGIVFWDFSKNKANVLPEHTFKDINNNDFQLQSLKNKTVYVTFWATWCKACLQEKSELEKLKNYFKDSVNIVFVDIALDSGKQWRNYIAKYNPKGIQLISKNEAKTREVFKLYGIPDHIIVNPEGHYRQQRNIENAYRILSNKGVLADFVSGRESENHMEFILVKITDNKLKTFEKLELKDAAEYFMAPKNRAYHLNELVQNWLNNFTLENKTKEIKLPKYVYFAVENTIQRNDSIINMGYFTTSDVVLQSLKSIDTKE
jgi:thiol-disulfide isomerase/thioredoxin